MVEKATGSRFEESTTLALISRSWDKEGKDIETDNSIVKMICK